MYVKILRLQVAPEEKSESGCRLEFLMECRGATYERTNDNSKAIRVLLERNNGEQWDIEVPPVAGNAVYFMNNDGKTIEYLRWG